MNTPLTLLLLSFLALTRTEGALYLLTGTGTLDSGKTIELDWLVRSDLQGTGFTEIDPNFVTLESWPDAILDYSYTINELQYAPPVGGSSFGVDRELGFRDVVYFYMGDIGLVGFDPLNTWIPFQYDSVDSFLAAVDTTFQIEGMGPGFDGFETGRFQIDSVTQVPEASATSLLFLAVFPLLTVRRRRPAID